MALCSNSPAIGPSCAAAFSSLVSSAVTQQRSSLPFTADIDKAEKGLKEVELSVLELTSMKRSSAAKTDIPSSSSPDAEPKVSTQGSSTGLEVNIGQETSLPATQSIEEENITQPLFSSTPLTTGFSDASTRLGSGDGSSNKTSKKTDQASIDMGYENIIETNHDKYPLGWPQLAAFLNSTDNFAIFRRFGTSHCRVLLHLQAEITAIEQELEELDIQDSKKPEMLYRLRRNEWYETWDRTQKDLLEKLRLKLSQYDDILLKDSKLRALAPTSKRDFMHVFHWIWDRKPLDKGEYNFIFHRDDFVSIANLTQDADVFDDFVKSCLSQWPSSRFFRFLQKNEDVKNKAGPEINLFSKARIAILAKFLAVCITASVLLVPIFLLSLVDMDRGMATSVILIFVLAFAALISVYTKGHSDAIVVGTCTYCAVLVTFLGNVQGNSGGMGCS